MYNLFQSRQIHPVEVCVAKIGSVVIIFLLCSCCCSLVMAGGCILL